MKRQQTLQRISNVFLFKHDFVPQFARDSLSTSFKVLSRLGWISNAYNGGYYALPPLLRSMEKLSVLVSDSMNKVGAMKISVPVLCKSSLLNKSERWSNFPELFRLTDRRKKNFALSATCEEGICDLVSSLGKPLQKSNLPLLLYQINSKFRDELHPRNGILRGREFLMKDLYSFDANLEDAFKTYDKVINAYKDLFESIGLNYIAVEGSVGLMGGESSHEFQVLADAGEDDLLVCSDCRKGYSLELLQERNEMREKCDICGSQLSFKKGIEIAHTFLLGTKYSKPFNITYQGARNDRGIALMGCFGIGISRLIAACLEQFSCEDQIQLPSILAPYLGVVIPQKKGFRFEESLAVAERVVAQLSSLKNCDDFLIDDRYDLSIGRRLSESRAAGIPIAIVSGKHALEDPPKLELHLQPSFEKKSTLIVDENEIISKLTALLPEAINK